MDGDGWDDFDSASADMLAQLEREALASRRAQYQACCYTPQSVREPTFRASYLVLSKARVHLVLYFQVAPPIPEAGQLGARANPASAK